MAFGLLLRVEQFAIYDKLEHAAIRRDEGERGNTALVFFVLKQFGHQTDSPAGVVSGRAVGEFDLVQGKSCRSLTGQTGLSGLFGKARRV